MSPVISRVTRRRPRFLVTGIGISRRGRLTTSFKIVDVPALIMVRGKGVMGRSMNTIPGTGVLTVLRTWCIEGL